MIETGASHANRKSAFGRRIGSAVAIVFAGLLLVATTTSGPAVQGDSRSETRAEPARSEQGRDTPPVPVQPLAPGQPASVTETAFSRARLIETAEAMARRPYQDRSGEVPDALLSLSYDQYRDIRYRPEATIWLNGDRTFSIDLMPAGFVFAQPVDVWLVENGKAARLGFDPGNYDLGPTVAGRMPDAPVPLIPRGFKWFLAMIVVEIIEGIAFMQNFFTESRHDMNAHAIVSMAVYRCAFSGSPGWGMGVTKAPDVGKLTNMMSTDASKISGTASNIMHQARRCPRRARHPMGPRPPWRRCAPPPPCRRLGARTPATPARAPPPPATLPARVLPHRAPPPHRWRPLLHTRPWRCGRGGR